MTDWETVTIRVQPDTKAEWEEYANTHDEAGNLSHLVRYSVSQEMSSEEVKEVHSGEQDERIGEILEAVNSLTEKVKEVNTRVQTLEREKDATDQMDLQKLLLEILPVPPEEDTLNLTPPEYGVTAEQLASQLGAGDTSVVLGPLQRLYDKSGLVRKASGGPDSETYWWKRE